MLMMMLLLMLFPFLQALSLSLSPTLERGVYVMMGDETKEWFLFFQKAAIFCFWIFDLMAAYLR
jgi:hypothetical protein